MVKDAISTGGIRTTAASRILENFIPCYDAFVIQKLKEAGAIILAKANMDEFAMGSATENSAFQKTRNPWNTQSVPGGSFRRFGSFCQRLPMLWRPGFGYWRLHHGESPRPFAAVSASSLHNGRVSRYGLFALPRPWTRLAPLPARWKIGARIFSVIAGFDARDNTYSPPRHATITFAALEKARTGWQNNWRWLANFCRGLAPEVKEAFCENAIDVARASGAKIIDVEIARPKYIASATYYIVAMAEAGSNLARYDAAYGRRARHNGSDELYVPQAAKALARRLKGA